MADTEGRPERHIITIFSGFLDQIFVRCDFDQPSPIVGPDEFNRDDTAGEAGREQEFEEWVSGILAAANEFPGYLGSEILRPSDPEDREYKIVFRFDHESNLRAWEASEERHGWLRKSRPLLHEKEKVQVLSGLETWFTLPAKAGEPPPPRYKMAVVTWLAVFPVVSVIFSLFGPWLNVLPTLVRTLVFTLVMVTLMTYVIMPRMTRLFSFWLYPNRE